jgi:hypothetical protein
MRKTSKRNIEIMIVIIATSDPIIASGTSSLNNSMNMSNTITLFKELSISSPPFVLE